MFRDDRMTVTRDIEEAIDGELVKEARDVYIDVPCHLSTRTLASLATVEQTASIATTDWLYKVFFDTALNVRLELNDLLKITTKHGQYFELYAGQSMIYDLTTQLQAQRDKIV